MSPTHLLANQEGSLDGRIALSEAVPDRGFAERDRARESTLDGARNGRKVIGRWAGNLSSFFERFGDMPIPGNFGEL